MSDTMIAPGPEIWLRAIGTAIAGASLVFAGCMLAYGGAKVRVNGVDHLAIFAEPRGPTSAGAAEIARAPGSKPLGASAALSVDHEADAQPATRALPRPVAPADRQAACARPTRSDRFFFEGAEFAVW